MKDLLVSNALSWQDLFVTTRCAGREKSKKKPHDLVLPKYQVAGNLLQRVREGTATLPNRIKLYGIYKLFLIHENACIHIYMYVSLYIDTYF